MRRKGRAGSLQSVLDLREGGVEASVPPEPGNAQRRFEIRTPAASTSVRGTRFLVQADAAGSTAADRKSTRLNSSHSQISYAVFCLKKKITIRLLQHEHRSGQRNLPL